MKLNGTDKGSQVSVNISINRSLYDTNLNWPLIGGSLLSVCLTRLRTTLTMHAQALGVYTSKLLAQTQLHLIQPQNMYVKA